MVVALCEISCYVDETNSVYFFLIAVAAITRCPLVKTTGIARFSVIGIPSHYEIHTGSVSFNKSFKAFCTTGERASSI